MTVPGECHENIGEAQQGSGLHPHRHGRRLIGKLLRSLILAVVAAKGLYLQ
jgi:hypothetical protein